MQRRKFAVLGLGRFGHHVARSLYEAGHDVLVADHDPAAVEQLRGHCSRALLVDVTDREALEAAGVAGVDVAVVGLGSKMDVSTLATLYLKEMGVDRIFAKAITVDHAHVLRRMGATEVVHPEADSGRRVAAQLARPDVVEQIPYLEGYAMTELRAPRRLWGVSLAGAELRGKHRLAVVSVKRTVNGEEKMLGATPDRVVEKGDTLLMFARAEDVESFRLLYPE